MEQYLRSHFQNMTDLLDPIDLYKHKDLRMKKLKMVILKYKFNLEYIYANLGRTATGNRFTKMINSFNFKNTANTSVLPLK